MPKLQPEKYIGKENYNNQGYLMKVIRYRGYDDIDIEFAEPYRCVIKTKMDTFLKGGIVNPYAPTICNVGIVGNKYSTVIENDGKRHCREYQAWSNILKRCYDEKHRYKNPSYSDVTCDPVWFYYENFYEWIHSQTNYDALQNTNYGIDKDILYKGNRIYSPDKCTLVPQRVNNLLLKSDAIRGDCPIGVFYHKRNRKYIAACGGKLNNVYLGSFNTAEDAFYTYKKYKENMIRRIAQEEFDKGTITERCYNALMNYEVEITD